MSELRMYDVRARGCAFTLYPAAAEAKVKEELMVALLDAAEYQFSKLPSEPTKRKRRPYWPQLYTKEDLLRGCRSVPIKDLIEAELIVPTSKKCDKFFLTKKTLDIFLRAKQIDLKLQREKFHYCPCQMF